MPDEPFDVFLAHNSKDKAIIRAIAAKLKRRNVKVWLDEEQIFAGAPFVTVLQAAVPAVKAAAILVGSNGLGDWQEEEVLLLLDECKKGKKPLFLVLLPGLKAVPPGFGFLKQRHWVDFEHGAGQALDGIEAGIKGAPVTPFADALLCFNAEDGPEVLRIEGELSRSGVQTWKTGISPSSLSLPVLRDLDNHLPRIWSMIVFVGKNGGPWVHDITADVIIEFRDQHRLVMPVILASAPAGDLRLPVFLRRVERVDLRQNEAISLERLLLGIAGEPALRLIVSA